MKLQALLEAMEIVEVRGAADPDITGLTYNSKQVRAGHLFVAVRGQRHDGHVYVSEAVGRGASAVLVEHPVVEAGPITQIVVRDTRLAMAAMAAAYHGNPGERLTVVGITGTNGKTTAAFMVRDILSAAGLQPGSIGTVDYQIGARVIPAGRTTPESIDLQSMLAQMVHVGCKSVVMEVSSHALCQQRVAAIPHDVAVFTNLTRDHLDYHGSMEEYFEAKAQLFEPALLSGEKVGAVVNTDDPWGRKLLSRPALRALPAERVVTCGLGEDATVRARDVQLSSGGSRFRVETPWGAGDASLRLLGRFNVENALVAVAVAGLLGIELDMVRRVLASIVFVTGRLEEVGTRTGYQVFVDYAHTDDALRNVLVTLREITSGRLIVVFGCGGNRDPSKRPEMGRVAGELADYSVLTSDNPRKEKPAEIIEAIRAGFGAHTNYEVIEDRRCAIEHALEIATRGDIVVIAGKGHENYQEFRDTVVPFDDRQVVRACLG